MTQLTLVEGQVAAHDRQAESNRRAGSAWSLDKIVFVAVLVAAYACAVLAVALPIYVWLD
jgi:hypothetical protein